MTPKVKVGLLIVVWFGWVVALFSLVGVRVVGVVGVGWVDGSVFAVELVDG